MRSRTVTALVLLSAGCGAQAVDAPSDSGIQPQDAGVAVLPNAAGEGLPCDVTAFLALHCAGCHGEPLQHGAVGRLLSRGDLLAPSPGFPGQTMGERALARMAFADAPMPPLPTSAPLPGEQVVLAQYIAAGAPEGTCDAWVEPTCSSGVEDPSGEGPLMEPGAACIQCHADPQWPGPVFAAAGTVYPSLYELDTCWGSPSVTVRITDANGAVHTATSNAVGNFLFDRPIARPYKAQVESGGRVRAMHTPQVDGDCNRCHAESGGALGPGRVVAP
jgi:hypothetical protein